MSKPLDDTSELTISRLAFYLRTLAHLDEAGHEVVSSKMLAAALDISAAQVRKDLSCFGGFGKQGTGYFVRSLREQLVRILHVDEEWPMVLVGAGNLGCAFASYSGFQLRGFSIAAIFDNDPAKIGHWIGNLEIRNVASLKRYVRRHQIEVALLAVPVDQAQLVAEQVVEAGISAILNYAPTCLTVPAHVCVEHVDPVIHLQRMTYHLRNHPVNSTPQAKTVIRQTGHRHPLPTG